MFSNVTKDPVKPLGVSGALRRALGGVSGREGVYIHSRRGESVFHIALYENDVLVQDSVAFDSAHAQHLYAAALRSTGSGKVHFRCGCLEFCSIGGQYEIVR